MTEKLQERYGERLDEQRLAEAGNKERDRLTAEREKNAAEKHEVDAESAKNEALEAARKVERAEREKKHASVAEKRRERPHKITKAAQKTSFKKICVRSSQKCPHQAERLASSSITLSLKKLARQLATQLLDPMYFWLAL